MIAGIDDQDVERVVKARAAEVADDVPLIPDALQEWWQRYYRTHEHHFRTVLSILGELAPGPALEVGAVPGHLTLLMARLGYPVEAVDLDPTRMSGYARTHGLSVQRVDVERERLPFPDGSFRIAVFTEVLEHLRWNPIFALEEIARVTQAGGTIVLSVPNITPIHRLRFLFGEDYQGDIVAEFEKLKWAGHMGHFRLYSRDEVVRMLTYAGFHRVEFRPPGVARRRLHALLPGLRMRFANRLYVVATRTSGDGS